MSRVLIVNMPFSNLRWPNLGPSLLKAGLARRGIACDIAYLNFDFAERVGLEQYAWIADSFGFVLGGERLFARHYFDGLPDDESYYRDVLLAADAGVSDRDRRDFEAIGRHVGPFLEQCLASIDWSRYAIVGFAASFQQTMPSMCLARQIKRIRPEMKIVFGGAACEGPMGIELLRQFPLVDYVFLGEADRTFPAVVEQIVAGGPVHVPPGVVGREARQRPPAGREPPSPPAPLPQAGEGSAVTLPLPQAGEGSSAPAPHATPGRHGRSRDAQAAEGGEDSQACMVADLDELPYPDFDDYFARWRASPLRDQIEPLLFYETSRGCWWGQKRHCLFCGLNGATLAYRSKSPRRAVDELVHLAGRYGVRRACSADNILDHRYFDTFLPLLNSASIGLSFAYEMKTNLTRRQVQRLLDAGLGAAQLGIETFSTPILRQIGKGASALQNLQTLKWFSEAAIEVKWNLLYGFPGEDPAEYARLAELLPLLVHLHPPLAVGRVRLDRFSPYFEDPNRHGMKNPRPNRAFGYVYPFPEDSLARLAYYFEFEYADGRNVLDYAAPVLAAAETWQQLKGTVTLRQFDRGDGVLIDSDTRPCATAFQHRLTGLERAVVLECDAGQTLGKLAERTGTSPTQLRRALDRLLADRLMVCLDGRYLSLALWAPREP
jgi:radical SAM superfamily enzyme YgiQ (UPF0313 family)